MVASKSQSHAWESAAIFTGRRGRLYRVVVCRWCATMAAAQLGSSPLRPGPCLGERPVVPIVWTTPRPPPTWRMFFAARG